MTPGKKETIPSQYDTKSSLYDLNIGGEKIVQVFDATSDPDVIEEFRPKTIREWEQYYGDKFRVYDPDGFDRTDPNLMTRTFTKAEFLKGLGGSTVSGVREVNALLKEHSL